MNMPAGQPPPNGLLRIVRMTFDPAQVEAFLRLFEASRESIRAFPGCRFLALYRDAAEPNVFYTYSCWASADELEAYRHSELFRETWQQTKPLFSAKPMAFSLVEPWVTEGAGE